MTRAIIKTLGVALVATLPMLASAQLTANVSLTTNYKFRGQDQDTSKVKAVKPALQGGFDYTFGETGFYVGNWNSSVNWLSGNSLESDIYGGYKFKAGEVDLDSARCNTCTRATPQATRQSCTARPPMGRSRPSTRIPSPRTISTGLARRAARDCRAATPATCGWASRRK